MSVGRDGYLQRIISALRFRIKRIFEVPPVPEIEFIGMTGNHAQFRKKLRVLGQKEASNDLERYINHIGLCWLRLSLDHLEDAQQSSSAGRTRATFSRSYYAAYNASKSIRYIVSGAVSLKGDDHPKASSDLPDDFPDVNKWSEVVTQLYEHRLRADYDNWDRTDKENTLRPDEALKLAADFVALCRSYLSKRLGATL